MNKAISELSQVQRPAESNTVAPQRLVLVVLETPAGLHGAANQRKLNEEYQTFLSMSFVLWVDKKTSVSLIDTILHVIVFNVINAVWAAPRHIVPMVNVRAWSRK